MNFQGRLNDSTGAPMPNGTYNMRFRIYSVASGGTALWTETKAVSASQGVTVTTGGLFSTQLGSVTSLPANIFNTSSPLYLEVELPTPGTATGSSPSWTEGAMSPRNPISSSPYAINSDLLDGLDSSAFAQASGSANYIQNQSASPQAASLYISGTAQVGSNFTANGPVVFKNNADSNAAFRIQNAAGSTLLNVNTVNNTITLGAGTSLTLTGGNTASRPASPTEGMVYYDTTTHQLLTYSNGKWQTNGNTTVVVAASNSTQAQKDGAQYVATGTNDQTTIANAINSLPGSGGTVYLLGGTYSLGASVTISGANVTLTGDTSAVLSRAFNGTTTSNGGLVYINGSYDTISNITLQGNSGTYTNATYNMGVGITGGTNQTIQGLTITNMAGFGTWAGGAGNGAYAHIVQNNISGSGSGIWFDSIGGALIENNVITGSTASVGEVGGIVSHNTSSATIANNTISGGAGNGIQTGGNTVTGNNVTSNAGIGITAGSGSIVNGNTVKSNNLGIQVSNTNSDVTVTNNYVYGSTTHGINYDSGTNTTSAVINDNTVSNNGYDGIHLNNTPCNVNVQNNRISNNGGSGAYSGILVANGCSTTVVTGNTITDTAGTGYAINISGGSGAYISGNTYSGTGASAIRDIGTGTIFSNQLDANGNLINSGVGALTVGTSTVAGTLSIQGGITAAQLTSPGAPTITNGGTAGVVSYSYAVTAYDGVGETLASSNGNTTTGNATLSATNYNTITWTEISGATSYKIYRTASSGTPATTGLIGTATATAGTTMSFNDTGLTASGAVPTLNMTGSGNFASQVQIGSGTTGLRLTSSGTTRALTFGDGTGFTFNIVGSGSTLATFQDSSGAGITLQRVTTINGGNNGLTVTTGATASGAVATFKKGNAATGDMLDLQNASGLNMSLFNANGDLIIGGANSSSSANALQVQNTSGASLLTVDTSANQVTIGSGATGNSTGYLLVLDTKNSAGDPTGVSGAMYYNSNGKFRCYQGGNWQNCASGSLYAATGDSTTINGATTGVQYLTTAYAMPANYCTQGRVIHIAANGVASTAATAQPIEFRMYVGGTAISSGNWTTKPNARQTNVGWSLDFSFTCRAAPSAASAVYGQGSSIMELGSGTTKTQLMYPAANPNTTNIATNASANIQIGVVFTGTTNAANTLTAKQMYINNY